MTAGLWVPPRTLLVRCGKWRWSSQPLVLRCGHNAQERESLMPAVVLGGEWQQAGMSGVTEEGQAPAVPLCLAWPSPSTLGLWVSQVG